MIQIVKIAEKIQNDLNMALAKKRGNELLQFKIHTTTAWESLDEREYNSVYSYIDGSIIDVTEKNGGVSADIGVLAFNIVFALPTEQPKTTAKEEVEGYNGLNFQWLLDIYDVLKEYFSLPKKIEVVNDNGEVLAFSYEAGIGRGETEQQTEIIIVAVSGSYSDGDLSTATALYFDGEICPQTKLSFAPTITTESGVSNNLKSHNFATSFSFPLAVTTPSRYGKDKISTAILDIAFDQSGTKLNEPHFLTIDWGAKGKSHFFMTLAPTGDSAGNATACLSATFTEATKITKLLTIASGFQIVSKSFNTSGGRRIAIRAGKDCYIFVIGSAYYVEAGADTVVNVTAGDYELNADNTYYVAVIASDNTAEIAIREI